MVIYLTMIRIRKWSECNHYTSISHNRYNIKHQEWKTLNQVKDVKFAKSKCGVYFWTEKLAIEAINSSIVDLVYMILSRRAQQENCKHG